MSAASPRISRLEPYLDRPEPAPTLLKMLVGVQLAGFREDAGYAQDQAARAVGFSAAKLSRIESGKGRRPPTETDVRALLQTPAYTRAVVERGLPSAPAGEVERRVQLRRDRARLLLRDDAPQLWAIIDESVLLRVLGSTEVMRDQLAHLIEMAERSNVTLQVVPLSVTNASAPAIPITYLRFGGLDLPDVVYLEHIKSANFLEDRDETEEYRIALDRLADEALKPRETLDLLRQTREQRYS
ncbi:helix-turn-helix domain-containing protein [Streptomyces sp. NPDC055952]|uniref:helix-turn-helix domain-containing protein n=1 Tax=Streptomyces sp. NPDC055952 TaxID=3345663 RepID=UPI0035D8EC29